MYLPLIEPFSTVAHPDEYQQQQLRWRGVAALDAADVLDTGISTDNESQFYAARIRRDGQPAHYSDLVDSESFEAMLRFVGQRMGELADALLDGDIEVRPYRLKRQMPCTWCLYRSVCRFETENQSPRSLASIDKAAFFERAKEADDHE
jgi:ATP-dependent helicase/nuclease subunit B